MHKKFNITSTFNVKSFSEEDDTLYIEGYANTTNKDRVGDVITEEAWLKGALDNYAINPIVLAYHDHTKPIGEVVDYNVSNKGLYIVAEISKAATEVYGLIKAGVLKAFSVGFRVKDADYDSKSDTFLIKDLELMEISVVSVPANAQSVFSIKKSFTDEDSYLEFKNSFDPEQDETIVSDLEKEIEEEILEKEVQEEIKETNKMSEITVESNVEKLLGDIALRLQKIEDRDLAKPTTEVEKEAPAVDLSKELADLRAELAEKSSEIAALQKSKMRFEEKGGKPLTQSEIDSAVIIAKALNRPIMDTQYGKSLIEKAGAHLGSMTTPADWENTFSTSVENDIRERLILEPLFRKIAMNTPTLQIPVNPDAGTGTWIGSSDFNGSSSTGTADTHLLTDRNLTAYKLVTKEYIGYEETEDSIINLVPIIRDAMVRRMARSVDIALLRGQASGATDPIEGIAKHAADASAETTLSIGASAKVTVDDLQACRRNLGVWGLDPSDVVYIVSHDAYFDLLEDADFRTMDLVGSNATILRGQIGAANGSPVIVSGEFEAKAATKYAVVALNARNFLMGQLRGLMVESDKDIEYQRNILVASRRLGFMQTIVDKGASVITWAA